MSGCNSVADCSSTDGPPAAETISVGKSCQNRACALLRRSSDDTPSVKEFVDIPEAHTYQDQDLEDCLICALGGYVDLGRPIPKPSPARSRPKLTLPPLVAAKLALYEAMRAKGLSRIGLARRFGLQATAVRRLIDLDHRSHIDQVAELLAKLGRKLEVRVSKSA